MLLIIGIDPGTTTGITALDLTGRILVSLSKKGLGQAGIVKTIERLGSPILISTDRSPPPQKVAKIAAAFSARLIWPAQSLTRAEKVKLFKDYFKAQHIPIPAWNRHQKDSAAAAIFVWKAFRPLITKISRRLARYAGRPYFDRLDRYVHAEVLLKGQNLESAIKNFFRKY